jgi:organic hydroperoxide reductase OsmC/OhrA
MSATHVDPGHDTAGPPHRPTDRSGEGGRVTARSAPGTRGTATANGGTVAFDATWGRPYAGLPGPTELLATAFAACLLKNLARARVLMGFDYSAAEADVSVTGHDEGPELTAVRYTLRVTTTETQRRTESMHRNLAAFGSVYTTLAAACDVSGEVVRVRPPDAPRG